MKPNLFTLFLLLQVILIYAQTDNIGIGIKNLRTEYLKEGTNQFSVWNKNESTGKVSRLILWERKVAFTDKNGGKTITVSQRRIYEDSVKNTYVYTVSDRKTFRTIYDYRTDKTGIQAFDYRNGSIVGSDTVAKNIQSGFKLSLPVFPY